MANGMLTVREAINKLQQFDGDIPVLIEGVDLGFDRCSIVVHDDIREQESGIGIVFNGEFTDVFNEDGEKFTAIVFERD